MPKFRVTLPMASEQRFLVEAKSAREAIRLAREGDSLDEGVADDIEALDEGATVTTRVVKLTDDTDGNDAWEEQSGDLALLVLARLSKGAESGSAARGTKTAKEGPMGAGTKIAEMATDVAWIAAGDAARAGLRAGAAEFADTAREPVALALLQEVGFAAGSPAAKVVGAFLRTPLGAGAFSYALGVAIPSVAAAIPHEATREYAGLLGAELRVAGQAALMRPVVRALAGPLREFLVARVTGGAAPGVRVATETLRSAGGEEVAAGRRGAARKSR